MKMFLLTLLACLMVAVCAGGPSQSLGESKLLQAMRSTNALQQNNAARSMECFQYYSEVFDQLLQEYEVQYQTCENNTQQQLATLDWLYKTRLSVLGNNAQSACQLIENCDSLNDTAASLNCYTKVGTEDAKTMYNISGTASQYNSEYTQQKLQIDYQLEQCATEAKNTYEVNTEQTYVRLQACLLGTESVPSTTKNTTGGTSSTKLIGTTTTSTSTTNVTTPPNTSSSPIRPTSSPIFSTTKGSSSKRPKRPKRTTTAIPATTTTTGAYTTNSIQVSKSTTVTKTSTSRRPISTIRPIITITTPASVTTTTKSETMTTDPVSRISSSSTSSSSSISSSNTTLPIRVGSTTASLDSTTFPVPPATSSSLVTIKPTVSAAPSLSSDLKKLLHSLLH